jgi:4-hydroxy-3-polyprenylbenzoate decarboxylase
MAVIADLRDFIAACEEIGELKMITAEVDWNLELSHVSKLNEERGGPALLFTNIKGYKTPVFTGALATTRRLALALGMPTNLSMCELAKQWSKRAIKEVIRAKEVDGGPVTENVKTGDDVNLEEFPVPYYYPLDGGRYIGTAVFAVVRDPETNEINLGTYRMQMLDNQSIGVQMLPGKRGERILRKYKKLGKPCPAAVIIGADPILLMAGAGMHEGANEYDVASTIRGEPVEVFTSDLTGLPLPARAEIILEGEIEPDPEKWRIEGPFGEYTGYYTDELRKPIKKPWMLVKRVMYRNNPILWATSVGRPVGDQHILLAFTRTATLWTELERMGIPGLQGVFIPPQAAGRFWVIASVKQAYPGHSAHVADAILATHTCNYGTKGIIIVDDDIAPDDLDRVWWALAVRYDPMRGTEIIKRGRSTPLDPALDPNTDKLITSRIIIDATLPYEWGEKKPVEVRLDEATVAKVKARWSEYGLD